MQLHATVLIACFQYQMMMWRYMLLHMLWRFNWEQTKFVSVASFTMTLEQHSQYGGQKRNTSEFATKSDSRPSCSQDQEDAWFSVKQHSRNSWCHIQTRHVLRKHARIHKREAKCCLVNWSHAICLESGNKRDLGREQRAGGVLSLEHTYEPMHTHVHTHPGAAWMEVYFCSSLTEISPPHWLYLSATACWAPYAIHHPWDSKLLKVCVCVCVCARAFVC